MSHWISWSQLRPAPGTSSYGIGYSTEYQNDSFSSDSSPVLQSPSHSSLLYICLLNRRTYWSNLLYYNNMPVVGSWPIPRKHSHSLEDRFVFYAVSTMCMLSPYNAVSIEPLVRSWWSGTVVLEPLVQSQLCTIVGAASGAVSLLIFWIANIFE